MRAALLRSGTVLVAVATVLGGLTLPAVVTSAAAAGGLEGLADVGATDPATGFPRWYEDGNGVRLQACVVGPNCAAGTTVPDPAQQPSVPGNFPDETFYYDASSTMTVGAAGEKATLTMAVEAAFGNVDGVVVDHDQITFSRIQLKVPGGLQPLANYTITTPYGVDVIQADPTGAIKPPQTPGSRYEHGCGGAPPDCDFGLLLSGRIGPFLTETDPAFTPPAGYLGDGATTHTVSGSPLGTNYFAIDGPGVGADGSDHAQTDLFSLVGQLAGPLQVSPTATRFPGTDVGTSAAQRHVTLTNIGAAPLTLDTANVDGSTVFTAGLGACAGRTLHRDDSCALDASFAPDSTGDVRDVIAVTATGADGVTRVDVPVRGLGREPGTTASASLAPDALDFAPTQVGATSDWQPVELTSAGTAPLSVLDVALAGEGRREYQLDRSDCPDVLEAGSCPLRVRFAPHHAGVQPASLVVGDDADGTPHEVPITGTGSAGLVATSPTVDPATGFPRWYEDSAGTRLRPCLESALYCAAGSTVPDPGAAPSVPDNFPEEAFYFLAQSTMDVPAATAGGKAEKAVFVAAVEAAFGNVAGHVVPGEQVTFSRIQLKVTGGLKPNATYAITNPYGVEHVTADGDGKIKPPGTPLSRYEYGCGAVPPACDFGVLLGGRLGPFLHQDTSDGSTPPAGFLGDGVTEHKVTGSPFGTNVFAIDGPSPVDGRPPLHLVQPLFTLNGMVTAGPSTPDLAAVSDTGASATDDVTGARDLTFTGLSDRRVPVSLYVDGALADVQTSDVDGSYSLTATDVPEGDHEVTATETVRGTESVHSAARTVHVDRTAPGRATVTGTDPASPGRSRTPAVRGTAEPGATVSLYGAAQCTGPVLASGSSGAFSAGIAATVAANSTTALSARQTDLAGNPGACSTDALLYVHDAVPPPAPAFGGQTPSGTVAQTSATVTFSLAEPGIAQCRLDGAAFTGCTSPTAYAALAAGAHTVDVRLVDLAGNVGPVASRTWTVDTVGPTAALADATATSVATTTPSFAFRLSEQGTARCALLPVQPSLVPCTSPATFGALADGTYTLQVQGTDVAGNVGPVTSVPVTVDTVAPPVAILGGPAGPTADATAVFTFGSTDPTASFACGVAPDGAPVPALSPCTSPARTPALPTGTFRFFVRSTDAAGNVTLTSRLLVVDRTAPAAPRGAVARTVSRSSIALRWRPVGESTAVVYRVFRDGARTATAVVRGTSWTDGRLRAGIGHSYRIVAVDAAGNASRAATVLGVTAGDVVRPRVTSAPRVSFGSRAHGRATVTVHWSARDAGLVGSYALWQRAGHGRWHPVALPSPVARSVTLQLATGRYTFRVRATDVAGNHSPVVTGAPVSVR